MRDYSLLNDTILLELLSQDDQKAFASLYDRYWDSLLLVAFNRLNLLHEAEECVQDVFIKLWKYRNNLQLTYSLNTYLHAAIRYRVLDLLASKYKKMKFADVLDTVVISDSQNADSALLFKELLDAVEAAVDKLPAKCQEVYRLSREQNRTHKQIAAEMNISQKTVEAHMAKALRAIKVDLTNNLPLILLAVCFSDCYRYL